jgi:hypothetical protein
VLWKAPLLLLREDQLPVCNDVELAHFPRFQNGVVSGRILDLRRETRSSGPVVSDLAVLDDDLHWRPPCSATARAGQL